MAVIGGGDSGGGSGGGDGDRRRFLQHGMAATASRCGGGALRLQSS